MQTVPEFKSLIISPVHPTHSNFNRLSETVTSCIWRTYTSPPKRVAAFFKRLSFPGKDDTSGDEEWELWRKRNLETLRARINAAGEVNPTYVLKPYAYRLENEPCVLVPWTSLGNISQYAKHHKELTEREKLCLLTDAAHAIAHLHGQQPPIVHGGIHPFEILITEERRAVLFDFGLDDAIATLEPPPTQATIISSSPMAGYCAPERVNDQEKLPPVDVYAFGGVILMVMSGDHPPEEGHASHETHKNLSEDHPLWPFLETLWANNGADRPTMLDVAQFLEGPSSNQPRNAARERSVHTMQHEDPPATLHPHLELLKTEALRHVVQLTKRRVIGMSARLSDLLERLDSASAPELKGELVYLQRDVRTGSFGNVSRCTWRRVLPDGSKSEETVAVKVLRVGQLFPARREDIEERVRIRLKREFLVWIKLCHRNILKLHGFRFEMGDACLVSPWCESGNLDGFLGGRKAPEYRIRMDLALQVGHGLTYLHRLDPPISHGDVKPSNVLIIRDEDPALIGSDPARQTIYKALLCDFGTSRAIEELPSGYTTQTRCGTAGYRAPELWTGGKPTLEGDVYAYGGLILKCYSLIDPFETLSKHELWEAVCQKCIVPPAEDHNLSTSDPIYQLVCRCCQAFDKGRPSIENAVEELAEKASTGDHLEPGLPLFW